MADSKVTALEAVDVLDGDDLVYVVDRPDAATDYDARTATIANANAYWALPSLNEPIAIGDEVQFSAVGSTPTNFAVDTTYYVVDSIEFGVTIVSLAATPGGTAITSDSASTGTWTMIGPLGPLSKKATVAELLAVTQGTYKNALDADTGITGDGTTDDSAAIVTIVNDTTTDQIYFPPATYLINRSPGASAPSTPGSPACEFAPTTSKRIVAHPDAIFKAGSSQDSTMFNVTTATAGIEFVWLGGSFDAGLQFNSTSIPYDTEYTPTNVTATSQDVANIWNVSTASTFRRWELGHMRTTSRGAASLASADLFDASVHHWSTGGGDTHILGGVNTGQEAYVHDITATGSPDHAVYMTASSADTEPTGAVVIERVNAYHCMGAVAVKRGMENYTVRDCYAFNNPLAFASTQVSGSSRRNQNGKWINCTAQQYWRAFQPASNDGESYINCQAIDGGVQDASDVDYTGSFGGQARAFNIEATTYLTIRQPRIVGAVIAGTKPLGFRIYSDATTATTDTTITDAYLDGVGSSGAEVAVGGATDPDRTIVNGLIIGDSMTATGPTLLGAGSRVSYGDEWMRYLTSDYTDPNNDTTTRDVTGFAFPYRSNAWYEVELVIHQYTATSEATDFTSQWTYSGTASGRCSLMAKSTSATGTTSAAMQRSCAWDGSVAVYATGSDTSATNGFPNIYRGLFSASTSGTLQFQAGKVTVGSETLTIMAGSHMKMRRVG